MNRLAYKHDEVLHVLSTLINRVSDIASHQGTAVTALTAPSSGQKIVALSSLPTNLTSIYNGRKNAAAQGTTSSTNVSTSTTLVKREDYRLIGVLIYLAKFLVFLRS